MDERRKLEKTLIALDDWKGKYFCLKRDFRVLRKRAEEGSSAILVSLRKMRASLSGEIPVIREMTDLVLSFVRSLDDKNWRGEEPKTGRLEGFGDGGAATSAFRAAEFLARLCSECQQRVEGVPFSSFTPLQVFVPNHCSEEDSLYQLQSGSSNHPLAAKNASASKSLSREFDMTDEPSSLLASQPHSFSQKALSSHPEPPCSPNTSQQTIPCLYPFTLSKNPPGLPVGSPQESLSQNRIGSRDPHCSIEDMSSRAELNESRLRASSKNISACEPQSLPACDSRAWRPRLGSESLPKNFPADHPPLSSENSPPKSVGTILSLIERAKRARPILKRKEEAKARAIGKSRSSASTTCCPANVSALEAQPSCLKVRGP